MLNAGIRRVIEGTQFRYSRTWLHRQVQQGRLALTSTRTEGMTTNAQWAGHRPSRAPQAPALASAGDIAAASRNGDPGGQGLRRREILTALALAPCGALAADLPTLIAKAKGSLCAVGTYNELSNPRFTFRGTGFFVGDGGAVATCWHVLPQAAAGEPQANRLVVQLPAGGGQFEYREAAVAASDRAHDLAVLKVSGRPGAPLTFADPTRVVEGLSVMFMGFPIGGRLGFTPVSHRGIVSSVITSVVQPPTAGSLTAGAIRQLRDGPFVLLQLDATAYPGNSGGPLLDADTGEVVGVISMVLVKGTRESALTHPSGISYAVPVQYLAALVKGS